MSARPAAARSCATRWCWRRRVQPGRDPEQARVLLRELAARPETLAPVERALALFEVGQLDRELGLVSDNDRLQAIVTHSVDQERLTAANRRLQAELDDNAQAAPSA